MNRNLQYFNLVGIVALAILCVAQWQTNRKANLDVIRLEKSCVEQVSKLDEQTKSLKGSAADLDNFRQQVVQAHLALKESETKRATSDRENRQLDSERDQLKSSVTNWVAAVSARDEQLKETQKKLESLARDRNETTEKFNALAAKYNTIVKDLNEAHAKLAALRSSPPNKSQ